MEDIFDKAELYLEGRLSKSEEEEFERQLVKNESLNREFLQYKMIREQVKTRIENEEKDNQAEKLLQEVSKDFFKNDDEITLQLKSRASKFRRRFWIAVAASAAVIALIFLVFHEQKNLYRQYAEIPVASFTTKGKGEADLHEAEKLFNEKKYELALPILLNVFAAQPENTEVQFYIGLCQLEMGQLPEAQKTFSPIVSGSTAYREDALWFLALTYLRMDNLSLCRETLSGITSDQGHYEEAQELLDELEEN